MNQFEEIPLRNIKALVRNEPSAGLCRKPESLSDAVWLILTSPSSNSGNFYIDDSLLTAHGITELEKYSVTPGTKNFIPDFFVD